MMEQNENKKLSQEEELFHQLVSKALKKDKSKFEFIKSLEELFVVNTYISGVKKVVKMFKNLYSQLQAQYVKEIESDSTNIATLVNLVRFKHCREFYEAEIALAKDMRNEYKAYVFGGHFIDTVIGNQRADEDLVDFRELPWRFF